MKLTGTEPRNQAQRPRADQTTQADGQCGYVLIIGYGNSLRRDDGAGVAMAQRLAVYFWRCCCLPVRLLTVTQLAPELAADIAAEDIIAAVFVDTAACNAACNTVGDVQVARSAPSVTSPSLGHQLDPTALLIYAELLYGRRPPAWLMTVPGADFDHGEGLSPAVDRLLDNVATVADPLLAEIKAIRYA